MFVRHLLLHSSLLLFCWQVAVDSDVKYTFLMFLVLHNIVERVFTPLEHLHVINFDTNSKQFNSFLDL
jgi:hypothetical protein